MARADTVSGMRYLRDTTLLTWIVLVTVLGALLWFAQSAGNSRTEPGRSSAASAPAVPGPATSSAVETVGRLSSLAPHGIAAGADPAALADWGRSVTETASAAAAQRAAEGAAENDPLLVTLLTVADDATRVARHAHDPVAASSARTATLMSVDRAVALTRGVPVAVDLPRRAATPLDRTGPILPKAPAGLGTPTVPTAPPAGHDHPVPSLDHDPLTSEDLK